MRHKGQSAVELTMVIGIFMVMASPFILTSQSSVLDLRRSSQFLQLDESLDTVAETSRTLNKKSFPARRTVDFNTPQDVIGAYNPSFETGSALVLEVDSGGASTNYSVVTDFSLEVVEWNNLTNEGVHTVSLRKTSEGVNMSVIS